LTDKRTNIQIPHCLDNRLIDGGKVVSPTTTILDIFLTGNSLKEEEREREEEILEGVVRDTTVLEVGVIET
jgi:hypothetical protein